MHLFDLGIKDDEPIHELYEGYLATVNREASRCRTQLLSSIAH